MEGVARDMLVKLSQLSEEVDQGWARLAPEFNQITNYHNLQSITLQTIMLQSIMLPYISWKSNISPPLKSSLLVWARCQKFAVHVS